MFRIMKHTFSPFYVKILSHDLSRILCPCILIKDDTFHNADLILTKTINMPARVIDMSTSTKQLSGWLRFVYEQCRRIWRDSMTIDSIQRDIFRATNFKKCGKPGDNCAVAKERIMPGTRQADVEGKDENGLNVTQMERQSVVGNASLSANQRTTLLSIMVKYTIRFFTLYRYVECRRRYHCLSSVSPLSLHLPCLLLLSFSLSTSLYDPPFPEAMSILQKPKVI